MKTINLLILLLFMQPLLAEEPTKPLSAFIKQGQSVEQKITGILNGDEYQDVVLVLKNPASPATRSIIVLLGTENAENFKLLGKNTNLQPCASCIGNMDKLGATKAQVTLEKGRLKIHWSLEDKRQLLEVILMFHYDEKLASVLLMKETRAREDLLAKTRDEIKLDYVIGIRSINGETQRVDIKPTKIDELECE